MIIRNKAQDNASDDYLRQVFAWLARIGACPKFGSRPIGWYQQHAMCALNQLEHSKACGFPVRCHRGMIQYKPTIGAWQNVFTATELYSVADRLTRSCFHEV